MSVQSPEELQTNLDEYKGQLEQVTRCPRQARFKATLNPLRLPTRALCSQVDELLTLDPGNAEYQDLHGSLLEVKL